MPQYIKKGKQVQVVVERKRLKARYLDDQGEWQTIVDGELNWDINKEESMWTLVPGEHIHVGAHFYTSKNGDGGGTHTCKAYF